MYVTILVCSFMQSCKLVVVIFLKWCYTLSVRGLMCMGLLPKDIELLPPYDDRIFKAFLTLPGSEPALKFVASAIINRPVVNVLVRNAELPVTDTNDGHGAVFGISAIC